MDDFASVKHADNAFNRGRFSIIEGLPHINDLIRPNEIVPRNMHFLFGHNMDIISIITQTAPFVASLETSSEESYETSSEESYETDSNDEIDDDA